MNFSRTIGFVALLLCPLAVPLAAPAQVPRAAKLYDRGVNAYFAGRSCQAEAFLAEAIQGNSHDPRAYYFRALSLLRQGRVDEARGDMLVGATLEAQLPQRFAIGAALERIQGGDRLMLEEFRRNARRDIVSQTSATSNLPPQTRAPQTFKFEEQDSAVLRERRIVPLEELLRPGGPQSIVEEPVNTPPPLPPQNDSPVAEPAQPPTAPAANDPFADDASKIPAVPAAPTVVPPVTPPQATPSPAPPATPPAGPDENPFGG